MVCRGQGLGQQKHRGVHGLLSSGITVDDSRSLEMTYVCIFIANTWVSINSHSPMYTFNISLSHQVPLNLPSWICALGLLSWSYLYCCRLGYPGAPVPRYFPTSTNPVPDGYLLTTLLLKSLIGGLASEPHSICCSCPSSTAHPSPSFSIILRMSPTLVFTFAYQVQGLVHSRCSKKLIQ